MRAILVLAALLPQDSYLPLKQGQQWTYVVQDVGAEANDPAREVVAEVGAADADPAWIPVSNYLGYRSCWLRSGSDGIELKVDKKADAPALTILKTSAKTGDTWTGTLGKEQVTFTLRGEDTLERGETRVRTLHVEFTASKEKHAGHAANHTSLSKVYELKP